MSKNEEVYLNEFGVKIDDAMKLFIKENGADFLKKSGLSPEYLYDYFFLRAGDAIAKKRGVEDLQMMLKQLSCLHGFQNED